ncbi:hypothetical protein WJ038_08770 [Vibrio parahaemolyticus]|uniref:hypothetical protein n=2 Tax=Vibrio parahaemolyticus TaxID=670 RepID=UPI0004A2DA11|nr:hypothetical protein [Vibrio parahaemolyticus]AMG07148.1 hypothetical protein AL464_10285 [Vibrio parahaemolyticus]EGR0429486.1 hypothetical protein [Vibrio parahaemolyticus]KKI07088.1 hypothetical protein WU75_22770 [Vibrio parahaemolyticus]MBY7694073.1 hypothetical protein [Vibrio parahaemolyticus]OOE23541.1 hypothetical protein BS100_23570 [Vibrio parahaemolyticus]
MALPKFVIETMYNQIPLKINWVQFELRLINSGVSRRVSSYLVESIKDCSNTTKINIQNLIEFIDLFCYDKDISCGDTCSLINRLFRESILLEKNLTLLLARYSSDPVGIANLLDWFQLDKEQANEMVKLMYTY